MQRHFRRIVWLAVASLVTLSLTIGSVLAHEGRPVGDYNFVVGWLQEPSYEGALNAVSVTITRLEEGAHASMQDESEGKEDAGGKQDSMTGMAGMAHDRRTPVEGLEGSIQVEVTFVPSGASETFDLLAVFGEPGHYVANLIPTASGVYEFRIFGSIEGMAIDETFVSRGGGGGFDDIRSAAGLHFPEELPELREIESGVRGALDTAQQAQDAALAAQESGGNTLAIVALIVGIAGVVIAGIAFVAIAVLPALRRQ